MYVRTVVKLGDGERESKDGEAGALRKQGDVNGIYGSGA